MRPSQRRPAAPLSPVPGWLAWVVLLGTLLAPMDAEAQPILIRCGPGINNCGDTLQSDITYSWRLREPGVFELSGTAVTLEYDDKADAWTIKRNGQQHGFAGTLKQEAELAWLWVINLREAGFPP